MRNSILITIFSAIALSMIAGNAFACGESMFRVGKDVHYRAYSAPIPGSVLVYARTDSERDVAVKLKLAGHNVHVVDNDIELALEMKNQKFDVVVAPYSKREAVEAQSSRIASNPDWVPVVENGSADARQIKSQYNYSVRDGDDIRKYLKAIHKSLKKKNT